jgi:hypothetical protein
MVGLGRLLEKPLGPVQRYDDMPFGPPMREMVPPLQTGELLDAVAIGLGLTVRVAASDSIWLQIFFTTTLYLPAFSLHTLSI